MFFDGLFAALINLKFTLCFKTSMNHSYITWWQQALGTIDRIVYYLQSACDAMGGALKQRMEKLAGMENEIYYGPAENIVARLQPESTIRMSVNIKWYIWSLALPLLQVCNCCFLLTGAHSGGHRQGGGDHHRHAHQPPGGHAHPPDQVPAKWEHERQEDAERRDELPCESLHEEEGCWPLKFSVI